MMSTESFIVVISRVDLLHSVYVMVICCHLEHLVVRLDMLLGQMTAHILRRRVMLAIAGDSSV